MVMSHSKKSLRQSGDHFHTLYFLQCKNFPRMVITTNQIRISFIYILTMVWLKGITFSRMRHLGIIPRQKRKKITLKIFWRTLLRKMFCSFALPEISSSAFVITLPRLNFSWQRLKATELRIHCFHIIKHSSSNTRNV